MTCPRDGLEALSTLVPRANVKSAADSDESCEARLDACVLSLSCSWISMPCVDCVSEMLLASTSSAAARR